jgi:hypothetical protein
MVFFFMKPIIRCNPAIVSIFLCLSLIFYNSISAKLLLLYNLNGPFIVNKITVEGNIDSIILQRSGTIRNLLQSRNPDIRY